MAGITGKSGKRPAQKSPWHDSIPCVSFTITPQCLPHLAHPHHSFPVQREMGSSFIYPRICAHPPPTFTSPPGRWFHNGCNPCLPMYLHLSPPPGDPPASEACPQAKPLAKISGIRAGGTKSQKGREISLRKSEDNALTEGRYKGITAPGMGGRSGRR
jgi:hypothetical protein